VKVGEFAFLLLGDPAHGSFKGVLGGADRAVVAGFGFTVGFEDRNDSFCFMDVESEVEFPRCV
jgi:hypothetical protein